MFNILVVDDENAVRTTLAVNLQDAGYTVFTAADAETALELLEQQSIDLIITDIHLPGARGDQLLEQINRDHPITRTIFISGQPDTESAINGLRAGALDFLVKPFNSETLLNSVRKARDILNLAKAGRLLQDRNIRLHALLEEKIETGTGELFQLTEQLLSLQDERKALLKRVFAENALLPAEQLLEELQHSGTAPEHLSTADLLVQTARELFSGFDSPDPQSSSSCEHLLERLVFRMQSSGSARVHLDLQSCSTRNLRTPQLIQIYYFVEEALQNSLQHSRAEEIRVATHYEQNSFVITVSDNGTGFSLDVLKQRKYNTGLIMLEKRAELANGTLLIESEEGKGTTVSLTIYPEKA